MVPVKKVPLKNAKTSSDLNSSLYKASMVIDGKRETYCHTKTGYSQWWSADFDGDKLYKVTKVRVRNSIKNPHRLGGAIIKLDDTLFGSGRLPNKTESGQWYEVVTKGPIFGSNIKVETTFNTCLHF